MCTSPIVSGEVCFEIADNISKNLQKRDDHLLLLNIIQNLLFYAKLQFSKEQETGSGGFALCQSLLSNIELLHSLYISKTGIPVSLTDLSNPLKVRQLRDKLTNLDKMKMAIDVATKCRVEKEPVFAAWGIALLRLGHYDEAKDKFMKCLVPPNERRMGGGLIPQFENSSTLAKIIEVLEQAQGVDDKVARQKINELEKAIKSSKDSKDFFNKMANLRIEEKLPSRLNSVRFMQCVFYLNKFGTPISLIKFWIHNHLLEDACRYVLLNNISSTTFIEEVFIYSLSHGKMDSLFQCLMKIDPQGTKSVPYMIEICKYLKLKKAYTLLLRVQTLMKDNVRAGLTCIKLFNAGIDINTKLLYLEKAQDYLVSGLDDIQNKLSYTKNFKKSDVNKHYINTTLQLRISKYFSGQMKNLGENFGYVCKLSLFESQHPEIIENLLLLGNMELANQVSQLNKISANEINDIHINVIKKLASRKQNKQIFNFFKQIKGNIPNSSWDLCVLTCVEIFVQNFNDIKSAESFVDLIIDKQKKIKAFIMVGQLKQAYLCAAKNEDIESIVEIRKVAMSQDIKHVVQLCNSFLSKNQSNLITDF